MSAPDRRAMVERPGKDLSVRRQCVLLSLTRSGVYRSKPVEGADDLAVMRRIDELHLELPFYGSRRMTFELVRHRGGAILFRLLHCGNLRRRCQAKGPSPKSEADSSEAPSRDGAVRSSVETAAMAEERRDGVIWRAQEINRATGRNLP